MSLLLDHSLADATSVARGEALPHIGGGRPQGFPLDGLQAWRLGGLAAAPGHAELDSDDAWLSVVRSWWGIGITWGLCVTGESGEVFWNLILPVSMPTSLESVNAHLTGAQLEEAGDFAGHANALRRLPFRTALAGHSGVGPDARLERAVRSLAGRDFMILVLAKSLTREEIDVEVHRLNGEVQFARDEHVSRQGLERDSHAAAARYLELIEAARERAEAARHEGGWLVRTIFAATDEAQFRQGQASLQGAFAADNGKPEPLRWQQFDDPRRLTFLRTAEAAALARPPRRELPGFLIESQIREGESTARHGRTAIFSTAAAAPRAQDGPVVAVGRILDDSGRPSHWLEIPLADLCRHLLIAGMTGSGKSVTCEHVLLSSWQEHRIPWLVIEPGLKTAYRRLLNSEIASDLNVLAIGNPLSPRLPMNPLAVPPGVGLAEHTSALFAVIASAFELVAPMPEVLATAIEQTYRNHGWNLAGVAPHGPPPRLVDLENEIDRSSRELGYGAEVTGNIRAGLLLRLRRLLNGPLAPELGSSQGIDISEITSKPTVIELSCLPDAESQALVMGLLALQLRHHWRMAGPSDSLRHLTVIEEAHRLLKAVPETSANAARIRAVEDIAHMLAELRGFGVGLAIVDQTPSSLVPSVIANTGTKILHRLDHPADRELAGRAAGLPADQVDLLGALKPGEAILRSDRRPKPFRLRMPNPAITYGKLPLPALEVPADPGDEPGVRECPVCRDEACHAYWIGTHKPAMKTRIRHLKDLERSPDSVIRQWVMSQLPATSFSPSPHQPRCFLLGLSQTAGLNEGSISRFLSALKS
jgi:hypothetical protein